MNKSLLKLIAILLFIPTSTYAAESTVETYVHKVMNESLQILNNKSLDIGTKTKKVRESLSNNLDATWMAKYTLGRSIKELSEKDINEFITTYTQYVVNSYANTVSKYNGETVEIKGVSTLDDGFFKVRTQVVKGDSNVINVDYLVHSLNGKYKVCDIVTEGISLISSQRSEYTNILEQESITALIDSLKKHTTIK